MVHFTCDLCRQELHPGRDVRYVVKMEVYAAYDPMEITDEDLEEDHMEEISQLLEQLEDSNTQEVEESTYKCFRFDLCPECQRKFLKDPLGREALQRINFSDN